MSSDRDGDVREYAFREGIQGLFDDRLVFHSRLRNHRHMLQSLRFKICASIAAANLLVETRFVKGAELPRRMTSTGMATVSSSRASRGDQSPSRC
jgi:hypothetical protein